jgi:hypothetical protein
MAWDPFCGCCRLQKGVQVLGIIAVIVCFSFLVFDIYECSTTEPEDQTDRALTGLGISLDLIGIIVFATLILGTIKMNKLMMIPALAYSLLMVIICIIFVIYLRAVTWANRRHSTFREGFDQETTSASIIGYIVALALLSIWNAYIFEATLRLYREAKKSPENGAMAA